MNYFYDIVVTAVLMTVLLATSSATGQSFVLSPQSKHTVMQIREFHECVSCHENNQIRKDYNKCLQLLSQQNRKIIKDCCVPTFDKKFCDRNFIGEAQFSTICTNPNKAFEVGRCFWKKTSNKNSSDIETYRIGKSEMYRNSQFDDKFRRKKETAKEESSPNTAQAPLKDNVNAV